MKPEHLTALATPSTRERFMICFDELTRLLGGDYRFGIQWFFTPHPEIGGVCPIAFVAVGDFEPVEWLINERLGKGAPA